MKDLSYHKAIIAYITVFLLSVFLYFSFDFLLDLYYSDRTLEANIYFKISILNQLLTRLFILLSFISWFYIYRKIKLFYVKKNSIIIIFYLL